MYIGELNQKQLISVALMVCFAMAAMFFMGYRYAFNKAVTYANDQIEEKIDDFKSQFGLLSSLENTDWMIGNLDHEPVEELP